MDSKDGRVDSKNYRVDSKSAKVDSKIRKVDSKTPKVDSKHLRSLLSCRQFIVGEDNLSDLKIILSD